MSVLRWINKLWHGGISGDQFLGIQSSVQSAKNVDLRSFGRQVKLSKQPVRYSAGTIVDSIMDFVTIKGTGDVIAFGSTGKIYRQVAGSGSFSLVYSQVSGTKITDAYEYNSYLYWCTASGLHRIAVANIDSSWSGDVSENYKTFTNGNSTYHPMIEVYNTLYIGDGKHLAELSSLGTWNPTRLPIFGDEVAVKLVFSGTYLRIYSQRSNNVPYSRCYLWDAVGQDYNQVMELAGMTVYTAFQKHNRDYLIAGPKPTLLVSSGFDYQVLQALPGFAGTSMGVFNHNCMTADEKLVYFGAMESGTNTMNRGVWSWGAKNKDYPEGLGNEYTTSNNSATDNVTAVHYSNGNIYYGWNNGGTYGIDVVDQTLYSATGEVITRVWDAGEAWQKKKVMGVKLAFAPLAGGEKIELFLRNNLSTSWTSVITADYNNTNDRNLCFKELQTNAAMAAGGTFNYLEAKIALTAGTSMFTSPIVTDLIIDAEPIQVK